MTYTKILFIAICQNSAVLGVKERINTLFLTTLHSKSHLRDFFCCKKLLFFVFSFSYLASHCVIGANGGA